jgi:hypothetical protein
MDGTQGSGKVLTSDANGVASWQTYKPPPGAPPDEVFPLQALTPSQDFALGTPATVNNSSFTVNADGFYSAEVRWWGDFTSTNAPTPFKAVFVFQLCRNGTVIDEFICHEYTLYRVTAFTALYAKASLNDVLTLKVTLTHGYSSFRLNSLYNGSMNWVIPRVLYKRLGLVDGTSYFD